MESLIQIIGWADTALFSALSVVSFIRWRRDGGAPVGWLAVTFAVLAFVMIVGVFAPEESDATGSEILSRIVVATLLLFPYFLFRFMAALRPVARWMEFIAGGLTATCVVASLSLPLLPEEGEPEPALFGLFIALVLFQWTALSSFVAVRLWR